MAKMSRKMEDEAINAQEDYEMATLTESYLTMREMVPSINRKCRQIVRVAKIPS